MPKYVVPVRFTGKIRYEVDAPDAASAMAEAEKLARNEDRLDALDEADYDVYPPMP